MLREQRSTTTAHASSWCALEERGLSEACMVALPPQVCDFNLSRMIAQQQQLANSGQPNSPGWQSPEMLAGTPYGKSADVFSLGVVMFEVMTLKEPWR
jgi:serine/threonine protein kinase